MAYRAFIFVRKSWYFFLLPSVLHKNIIFSCVWISACKCLHYFVTLFYIWNFSSDGFFTFWMEYMYKNSRRYISNFVYLTCSYIEITYKFQTYELGFGFSLNSLQLAVCTTCSKFGKFQILFSFSLGFSHVWLSHSKASVDFWSIVWISACLIFSSNF